MASLDLGVIGNCVFSALIDRMGRIVWSCLPRFDADPVFCDLLAGDGSDDESRRGFYDVVVDNLAKTEQWYVPNTAVLVTRLEDIHGAALEIHDFAPRFRQYGRQYRPMAIARSIRPVMGTPRIRIRLRPVFAYGATPPQITHGSNHIRYVGPQLMLRLTTNAPVSYVLDERPFHLEEAIALFLGPDEPMSQAPTEACRDFLEKTITYWREWVRHLAIPLEWQEAVIRAAITLKLCCYEETGAIIAAMTTSVPEASDTIRNWDYRYCWLRDAFFVIRALNSIGAVDIMENYLRYLRNVVSEADGEHLQPVYGITLERKLVERELDSLPGYRGMGPVRVGNQAYEHIQHDVYGDVVLASTQSFFDSRLLRPADERDFEQLEKVGERAFRFHSEPDAGIWELRTMAKVHTSSSIMCWAACDRLARIADHIGLPQRAKTWRARAQEVRTAIEANAWNKNLNIYADSFGGKDLDASLLLMSEVAFVKPDDPRFASTVDAIEKGLRRGSHLYRYIAPDDFGEPRTAFNICTFWYIEALAAMGRRDEARSIFCEMLACRNHVGLLSEDIDTITGELWGNFPQTYSMVGIINGAMRLSKRWQEVL